MKTVIQLISGCLSHRSETKILTNQSDAGYTKTSLSTEFDWSVSFSFFFLRCDNQPEFDAIAFKRNNTLVLCDLKTKGCKHTSVTLFSWL